MKKKLLTVSLTALIALSASFGNAAGVGTFIFPGHTVLLAEMPRHANPGPCPPGTGYSLCCSGVECAKVDLPGYISIWFDYGMLAATLLDNAAVYFQGDRTIDAADAIEQLEEALSGSGESGSGGSSGGGSGGGSSGDSSDANAYAADNIMHIIEVSEGKQGQTLFDNVRTAVKEYLFETSASDIKGDCGQSDRDCAVERQNEWLLASVTLASASADKVLDKTAKKNTKEGKTEAEKSEDETGDTKGTGGGSTSLTGHFSSLASSFNSQTTPMGLYNAMASIVLDTHRQANDANALMGRDLEAQGLRVINETGPVSLTEESETEE